MRSVSARRCLLLLLLFLIYVEALQLSLEGLGPHVRPSQTGSDVDALFFLRTCALCPSRALSRLRRLDPPPHSLSSLAINNNSRTRMQPHTTLQRARDIQVKKTTTTKKAAAPKKAKTPAKKAAAKVRARPPPPSPPLPVTVQL